MSEIVDPGIGNLQINEYDILNEAAEIFVPPKRNVTTLNANTVYYKPTNLSNEGPYSFVIPPRGDKFLQLNRSRLYIKAKITHGEDKSAVDNETKLSIVNMFPACLFDSCSIKIGNTVVSELTNTHLHFKTYLETQLSYANDAKKTHLKRIGYIADDVGLKDTINIVQTTTNNVNSGFKARNGMLSKSIEFHVPLHADFLQIGKYFPPNQEIEITLRRAPLTNFIHGDKAITYHFEMQELELELHQVELVPQVSKTLMLKSQTKECLFPFNHTKIFHHIIPSGNTTASLRNLIRGPLPKQIFFFMTKETAPHNIEENVLNFNHFNLNKHYITVNNKMIPNKPFTPDFANKAYMRLFSHLYDSIGVGNDDTGCLIDYDRFGSEDMILAHDLTGCCAGYHLHIPMQGILEAEFEFATALTQAISLYTMAIYDAVLHLPPLDQAYVKINGWQK